jgi:flagellar hook-associated protein 3 FlgL
MIAATLGDRAQLFTGMRHNADIRSRLNALTGEMSSGRPADMVAHRQGDIAPLYELDRRLALAESYGAAAREVGSRLAVMQSTLEQVETTRARVLDQIIIPSQIGSRPVAAMAAHAAFEDIAVALNARWGDGSLFAGTDTAGPALAQAAAMLASIRTAATGATDAAEVEARLDTWFDDPTGGFATMAYQGSTTDMARPIDAEATVRLGVRADHPALRGLLKAAALGVLAGDTSLNLPATRETAWGILRNEMTLIDPFATASEIEALRTRLETHYEITGRLNSLSLVSHLR